MARSKIVSESEVVKWIEDGKTYRWMAEEYERKYGLQVGITMFSNFRRRHGLDNRIVRNAELIPWTLTPEHRHAYFAQMLRIEGRRRLGQKISAHQTTQVTGWKRMLRESDAVVHYDPETIEGFVLMYRRDGIDHDLIREPDRGRRVMREPAPA